MGAATDLASYVDWCDQQTLEVCGRIAAAIRTSYGSQEKMIQHSVCRNAAKLTMPCLFYHGVDDRIIPVSQARRLAGLMADSSNFFYREIYQGDHDSPCAFMPEVLSLLLENIC
jgi:pimeloyl-ACP methyl ester carboxylesterase